MAPLRPASRVRGLSAYRVPSPSAPIDLDLRGNEGAEPDPSLCAAVTGADLLRRYPDTGRVRELLANRLGVAATHVLVTAGGDDALDRVCRASLEPGRTLVMPQPGFEMTRRYAQLAGAELVCPAWPGAAFPLDQLLERIDERTGLVALTSPNNPTGAVISPQQLDAVAQAARAVGALVLVDLAYGEFADVDLTAAALAHDNAVVVRTLSKAWGLAGVRVGCVLGQPEVLAWLAAAGAPFAVAAPSLAIAQAALQRGAPLAPFVEQVRRGRRALEKTLTDVGCRVVPSQANFVFARTPYAATLARGLAGLGIAVRTFATPELSDALRIAVPPAADEVDRVCQALRTVVAPQAVLLDMDGVLVDVSTSYRRAIVETAAAFGVQLSAADVASRKAQGDANNDWVVTWEFVRRAGVDVTLDAVTAEFERRYQGTTERPGLWATERALVDAGWISWLQGRLPVAVVTGRPRRDAERLLASLGASVDALVTMEDAPAKPDPAPVLRALQQLGVTRAWMVGDTPDDMVAARRAGVLPIGVLAPGDRDAGPLERAGAACVLDELDALLGVLP